MPSAVDVDSNKDVFTTPPTTPSPPEPNGVNGLRPSLSRNRSSRPSSIHTEHSTLKPDITILEGVSPNNGKAAANGSGTPVRDGIATFKSPSSATPVEPRHTMQSPCYVHSHLDKSASLAEWLCSRQPQSPPPLIDIAPVLRADNQRRQNPTSDSHSRQTETNDDDDEFNGSLTKQLADTAVGVREMSKQLGESNCIIYVSDPDRGQLRSYSCKVIHSEHLDYHQGPRQQANQTDPRTCLVLDAEATEWSSEGSCCVCLSTTETVTLQVDQKIAT